MSLPPSAQKVQDSLNALGSDGCEVVEMPDTTRTSAEAAAAIGCAVAQIAKSLVFKGRQTGQPVLDYTAKHPGEAVKKCSKAARRASPCWSSPAGPTAWIPRSSRL